VLLASSPTASERRMLLAAPSDPGAQVRTVSCVR
jgi:hypothetical protein